ncbi:Atxe2 family lasso peptide isopeptidase [Sphingobium sp. Cam5-1]|uniref:Atxe2 family lasso peptide isopeptidase n=1 Tax=Sphingobium sp. Cam5-1 TaxID=2789327 RepID=UPI0018AD2F6C|nr:Atxe2 family lasso peptide isopeptidase [Sphingobium sp. Cam5-1]QPI72244.1 Atxe2 family lasso peptide isopeptidase [Sphingobium sp. Cam5-1]
MVSVNFCYRLGFAALCLLFPITAQANCDDVLPSDEAPVRTGKRDLTAADLIQLREIGDPDSAVFNGPSPFAVSPDGDRIAYIINRADLATNTYCRALVVSRLTGGGPPSIVDRGGELIKIMDVQRGFYLPSGATRTIVPSWSPDGRMIAYLRRDNGATQAWVAQADGSGARTVTRSAVDVEAVAWSSDGLRLLYGTRKGAAAVQAAIDREGQSGWLYDRRISPEISARPMTPATDALDVRAIDLRTGSFTPATAAEQAAVSHAAPADMPIDPKAIGSDGSKAYLERQESSPLAPARLVVANSKGSRRCDADACAGGILSLWRQGSSVLFLRREGWAKETIALYRWRPGASPPKPILRTTDVLHGCVMAGAELICTREDSATPRKIVAIDTTTGRMRTIFDPNPEFSGIRLGSVTRLKWHNNLGLEAWGDLILPPGHKAGTKLPMVVVQYHSDGFLRGGTGDEYPIFLLAQRGFAVLSTERPTFFAAAFPQLRTWYQINAANQKDWGERRSLLSSLLTGVHMAVDHGDVDPARVGITGLSDGASTVAFALINSKAFAAAALSTCCMEPNTTATYGGIAWAEWLRGMGYPPATHDNPDFWRDMSLARNAARIDAPLLMQLADNEFRLALEAFGALHEQNKPVEMYVYPDEYHVKWQPIHRLAVYERNLDWFSFWLQGREDSDPGKIPQYRSWRSMRSGSPQPPVPVPIR